MAELNETGLERDPDPLTAIQAVISAQIAELYVCLPGVIESWDGVKASVRPTIQRVYLVDGTEKAFDMPVITDVPVEFPRGGGFAITFPLKKGDPVTLYFSQRSLDKWTATDGKTNLDTGDNRRFDISDAIARPGLYTFKAPIATAHAEDLVIAREDGSGELHIKANGEVYVKTGKVMLGADAASKALALAEEVKARLDAIQGNLDSHTHSNGNMGAPTGPSLAPLGALAGVASTRVFADA